MEVFVIIVEHSGIYEFSGIGFSAIEAHHRQKEYQHAMVLKEDVDEDKVVNNEFYVGAAYDMSPVYPDYRGIYYSYAEARKVAGRRGSILPFRLPQPTEATLEVH